MPTSRIVASPCERVAEAGELRRELVTDQRRERGGRLTERREQVRVGDAPGGRDTAGVGGEGRGLGEHRPRDGRDLGRVLGAQTVEVRDGRGDRGDGSGEIVRAARPGPVRSARHAASAARVSVAATRSATRARAVGPASGLRFASDMASSPVGSSENLGGPGGRSGGKEVLAILPVALYLDFKIFDSEIRGTRWPRH